MSRRIQHLVFYPEVIKHDILCVQALPNVFICAGVWVLEVFTPLTEMQAVGLIKSASSGFVITALTKLTDCTPTEKQHANDSHT